MQLNLTIDSGNAALVGDDAAPEVARILREAAERVLGGDDAFSLFDYNGNRVGRLEVTW